MFWLVGAIFAAFCSGYFTHRMTGNGVVTFVGFFTGLLTGLIGMAIWLLIVKACVAPSTVNN